jgi:hypothetical protein
MIGSVSSDAVGVFFKCILYPFSWTVCCYGVMHGCGITFVAKCVLIGSLIC